MDADRERWMPMSEVSEDALNDFANVAATQPGDLSMAPAPLSAVAKPSSSGSPIDVPSECDDPPETEGPAMTAPAATPREPPVDDDVSQQSSSLNLPKGATREEVEPILVAMERALWGPTPFPNQEMLHLDADDAGIQWLSRGCAPPLAWRAAAPAEAGNVYVVVTSGLQRKRASGAGGARASSNGAASVDQMVRDQIVTIDQTEYRVVAGMMVHATTATAYKEFSAAVPMTHPKDWQLVVSRPTPSNPQGLSLTLPSKVRSVRDYNVDDVATFSTVRLLFAVSARGLTHARFSLCSMISLSLRPWILLS